MSFGTTSVGTASGVFGVGFEFFNSNSRTLYDAFVTFGDGTTQNYSLAQVSSSNFDGFFGISSDLLISSIHLGLAGGGATQSGFFGLDNLTIGNDAQISPVPVPASLPLIIAGLAALGFTARRRRKLA